MAKIRRFWTSGVVRRARGQIPEEILLMMSFFHNRPLMKSEMKIDRHRRGSLVLPELRTPTASSGNPLIRPFTPEASILPRALPVERARRRIDLEELPGAYLVKTSKLYQMTHVRVVLSEPTIPLPQPKPTIPNVGNIAIPFFGREGFTAMAEIVRDHESNWRSKPSSLPISLIEGSVALQSDGVLAGNNKPGPDLPLHDLKDNWQTIATWPPATWWNRSYPKRP